MSIIKEYLKSIEIGEVNTYKNMTTVEIKGMNFPEIKYITLKEAMNKDLVEITEVNESGSVPTLNVLNKGDLPILLFDGEELKGAKQNRVLNTTVLIPEHTEQEIPVSCVEQGRWDYASPQFQESGTVASSKVRMAKNVSVSASLKENDSYRSNQGEVWDKVEELCFCSDVQSPTSAMNDVFEAKSDDISDYIKEFPFSNQNGILIFINNELKGMEFLSTEANYENYHEKIIKSYSIDALIDIPKENVQENNIQKKNIQDIDFVKESKEFIDEIATIKIVEKPSVGYGYDCRFVNENIAGAILVHENSIIHGAFFKKINEESDFDEEVVSSSQRARNYRIY